MLESDESGTAVRNAAQTVGGHYGGNLTSILKHWDGGVASADLACTLPDLESLIQQLPDRLLLMLPGGLEARDYRCAEDVDSILASKSRLFRK